MSFAAKMQQKVVAPFFSIRYFQSASSKKVRGETRAYLKPFSRKFRAWQAVMFLWGFKKMGFKKF